MDEIHPDRNLSPYSSLLTYVKDRPGHDRRYAVDAGKITGELEYAPIESFETGMRKTIVWYLENLEWCKEVMGEDYQKWLKTNYS